MELIIIYVVSFVITFIISTALIYFSNDAKEAEDIQTLVGLSFIPVINTILCIIFAFSTVVFVFAYGSSLYVSLIRKLKQ